MKKLFTLIIFTVLVLFVSSLAQADVLEVGPSGGGVGTLDDIHVYPFSTIQAAVDFAQPDDTIIVHAGTYNESVTVNKSLTLLGAKSNVDPRGGAWTGDITTINAGNGNNGILITASGVTVNGFKITGSGVDAEVFKGTSAIYVYNETTELENIVITYNWVDDNYGSGIIVRYANEPVVEYNYISNNGDGVWAAAGIGGQELINGSFSYNEVFNSVSYGIYLGGEKVGSVPRAISGTLISHNNLHHNEKYGLQLYGMYDPPLPHDVRIENNDFHDNGRNGIKLTDFTNTIVKDNQFSDNGKGAAATSDKYKFGAVVNPFYSVAGTQFTGNTFSGNELGGIYFFLSVVGADLSGITVNGNSFLGDSTKSGITNITAVLIDATTNWWGNATGPYHLLTNIAGLGNEVSDNVDYDPWCSDETCGTTGTNPVRNITKGTTYDTINAAIADADPDNTILVSGGIYDETLDIDGMSDLNIIGEDKDTTIIKSSTTLGWNVGGYGETRKTVVRIVNSTDVSLKNLTIDCDLIKGNSRYGVFGWDSSITVDNCILKNISVLDSSDGYSEIMSYFRASGYTDEARAAVNITNCTFIDAGRVGIVTHDYITADISGNTFYKTFDDFGYAVELGSMSNGSITGNTIYGYDIPAASDGSSSAGLYIENSFTNTVVTAVNKDVLLQGNEIYDCQYAMTIGNQWNGYAGNVDIVVDMQGNNFHNNVSGGLIVADEDKEAGSSVTINGSGNTIADNNEFAYFVYTFGDGDITVDLSGDTLTSNQYGMYVGDYPSGPSGSSYNVAINCSDLSNNSVYGVDNEVASITVDATKNWWGDVSGPSGAGGGSGSAVSANVDFFPWLLSTNCGDYALVETDYVVDDDWAALPDWTPVTVNGKVYYIGLNAFDVIQEAVDAATDGNSISVLDGQYFGASVNEDLTIVGDIAGGSVITDGPHYGGGAPGLKTAFKLDSGAGGAEIVNFTIDCNSATNFYFAIFSRAADNVVVDSLTINNPVQGITNYGGSNWQITDNLLNYTEAASGGGIAIYLGVYPPDYIVLQDSIVKGNAIVASGTAPDFTCPGILMALDLRYGRYDLLTGNEDISYNKIVNNSVTGTGADSEVGIEIGVIGLEGDPNKVAATLGIIHDNIVRDNIIENTDWGLYFYTVSDLMVLGNKIVDCNDGIRIEDGHKGTVINFNSIYGNASYGVNNIGSVVVDATYNWWGDVSGPYDPVGTVETDGKSCADVSEIKNADGLGNGVTEKVIYCAWLMAPVNTSTNPCPLGDLDGDCDVDFADLAILANNWLVGTE